MRSLSKIRSVAASLLSARYMRLPSLVSLVSRDHEHAQPRRTSLVTKTGSMCVLMISSETKVPPRDARLESPAAGNARTSRPGNLHASVDFRTASAARSNSRTAPVGIALRTMLDVIRIGRDANHPLGGRSAVSRRDTPPRETASARSGRNVIGLPPSPRG
jgi:hypothetical protein